MVVATRILIACSATPSESAIALAPFLPENKSAQRLSSLVITVVVLFSEEGH
ncbi:hypothetical protein D3C86_1858400 [compost metagenome]